MRKNESGTIIIIKHTTKKLFDCFVYIIVTTVLRFMRMGFLPFLSLGHISIFLLTYAWLCAFGRCGRPNDILGIDGDVYKDKSLMLSRPAPWKFGSSFSS